MSRRDRKLAKRRQQALDRKKWEVARDYADSFEGRMANPAQDEATYQLAIGLGQIMCSQRVHEHGERIAGERVFGWQPCPFQAVGFLKAQKDDGSLGFIPLCIGHAEQTMTSEFAAAAEEILGRPVGVLPEKFGSEPWEIHLAQLRERAQQRELLSAFAEIQQHREERP